MGALISECGSRIAIRARATRMAPLGNPAPNAGARALSQPEGLGVDQSRSARCEAVHIHAEGLLRLRPLLADLETGLVPVIGRDQNKDVAVERRDADFFREGDLEAKPGVADCAKAARPSSIKQKNKESESE